MCVCVCVCVCVCFVRAGAGAGVGREEGMMRLAGHMPEFVGIFGT